MTTTLVGDGPLLVVDDDPIDIELLRRCFVRSVLADDYELDDVQSGPHLLEYMDRVESGSRPMPSIVLLDINMPGMNGFEVFETVRSRPTFQSVPKIMFVSNSDNPSDRSRAHELGADFAEKFDNPNEGTEFFNNLLP